MFKPFVKARFVSKFSEIQQQASGRKPELSRMLYRSESSVEERVNHEQTTDFTTPSLTYSNNNHSTLGGVQASSNDLYFKFSSNSEIKMVRNTLDDNGMVNIN